METQIDYHLWLNIIDYALVGGGKFFARWVQGPFISFKDVLHLLVFIVCDSIFEHKCHDSNHQNDNGGDKREEGVLKN